MPSSRRRSGKECPLILNAINSGDPSTSPPGWSRRYSKGSLPVLRNANRLTVRCRALLCALLRGAKSIPQLDYGEEQAGLETDERFLDQLVSNFETLAHMQRMGVLWGFRLMTLNGQVIESECLGQPVNPPRFSANIGSTSVAARSAVHPPPAVSNAFVPCQAKKRLRWSGLGTRQKAALDKNRRRYLAMNL